MAEYEERLILFIDFLSFKEHVHRTVSEPDHLEGLVSALHKLREVSMETEVFQSQQMTHFSDSVVLSYRVEEPSAVFWLLSQIALAIMDLTASGFLVRGAVTVGPLLHTPEVLLGPAMLEAYRLESTLACYPRVIVDPSLLSVARDHRNAFHHSDEEESFVRRGLIEDDDGHLWIDYISYQAFTDAGCDPDEYPDYIAAIGKILRTGLGHPDLRVVRKQLWLHKHYAASITAFRSYPASPEYDTELLRLSVANLSRLDEDAQRAQHRLDGGLKP